MVESPPERGEKAPRSTPLTLPISLEVIPTPPRWGPIPFIAGETSAIHLFTRGMPLLLLKAYSGWRSLVPKDGFPWLANDVVLLVDDVVW